MTWLDGMRLDREIRFVGLGQSKIVRRKVDYWRTRDATSVVAPESPGSMSDGRAEPCAE